MCSKTRLTVGQALIRFLAVQYSERDGVEHRLIEGCFGIFGHGNLAGVAEALLEVRAVAPGRAPLLPSAQRAGDGAHGLWLCPHAQPSVDFRLPLVCRTWGDQYGDRGGDRHGQPDPRPAPTL